MMTTIRVGDRFVNNKGREFTITKYISATNVAVLFDSGFETTTQASHIRTSKVKDKLAPCVKGVGAIGDGKYRKVSHKNAYTKWTDMLCRCYSEQSLARSPAYIGVTVCDEWLNFQNFAQWYTDNVIEGYEIDKDFMRNGNKVYSPSTCCFIPVVLNNLLRLPRSNGMAGVKKLNSGMFCAVASLSGKRLSLGTYDTEQQAHAAWKHKKVDHLYDIMSNYHLAHRVIDEIHDIVERLESDEEWTGI